MLTVPRCRRKLRSSVSPQNSMQRCASLCGSVTSSSYRMTRRILREVARRTPRRCSRRGSSSTRPPERGTSSDSPTASPARRRPASPAATLWIPCHPFHHSTVVYECATARPSLTTWMNLAFGKIPRRNPILDQPEYSAMNIGLRWYRMMPDTASRNSVRDHSVTSSNVRSGTARRIRGSSGSTGCSSRRASGPPARASTSRGTAGRPRAGKEPTRARRSATGRCTATATRTHGDRRSGP